MFPIETSHVEPFVTQIVYIIVGWGAIVEWPFALYIFSSTPTLAHVQLLLLFFAIEI